MMPVVIRRHGKRYEADILAMDGREVEWTTAHPMSRDALAALLQEKGCHPIDIGDAFYKADPEWLLRSQE